MRVWTGFVATLVAVGTIAAIAASTAEAAAYTEYFYTGSEQKFAVPANVTGVNVDAVGARGASCCGNTVTEPGGYGGELFADVRLPAGTSTLYVEVGGDGTVGSGGWNGGGGGPLGGGGASDIRTVSCSADGGDCATGGSVESLSSRLAVAPGGGGASADGPGLPSNLTTGCTLCGTGASLYQGGMAQTAATVTTYCQSQGHQNGEVGSDGGLGLGGPGAYLFLTGTPESGGGGGGWYGGAGGAQCYDSGAAATTDAGAGGGGSWGAPASDDAGLFSPDTIGSHILIISAPVPTPTSTPTVAGGLTVGDVLSEKHAGWSTPSSLTGYKYQWERCDVSGTNCTAIGGATAQTYTLATGDVGDTIRVQETAENFYGSSAAAATSAATGVVGEPPISNTPPGISGTPTVGQVLLETHGTWTDGPVTGYDYQWKRCRAGSCTAIIGAVNHIYTLTAADVGSAIEVQETAANGYGTSAPATSAATSTVQPATTPPPPATRFTLFGSPAVSATAVSFSVLCRAAVGTACRGSARLSTLERLLGGKVSALLASAKRHSKRVLVGSTSFTLAAGAQKEIVVPLNALGHKLLARFHRMPATLTIALLNTTPPTNITAQTTIKANQNRHKHHH
jgi:hypothetical protein